MCLQKKHLPQLQSGAFMRVKQIFHFANIKATSLAK
jgi:hypothetical protein